MTAVPSTSSQPVHREALPHFKQLQQWREYIWQGGSLLHLDNATMEMILKRVIEWRHVLGESIYTLIAFATYDTLMDLNIAELQNRIAWAFDVPRKRMMRIERKLLRVRPGSPKEFLPLITKQWDLTFGQHKEIGNLIDRYENTLMTLPHASKSIACAVAFIHLQHSNKQTNTSGWKLPLLAQQVGMHETTLRSAIRRIRSLI